MTKFLRFFYNPRNLFILGALVALVVTFLEVSRGRHANFMIFANATLDFWRGVSPYTTEWISSHGRYFLYTPIFSVLFTPFTLLPSWLAPFAWNMFNYTMLFTAIFTLPQRFTTEQKCRTFLFLLLIVGQSLLSFQYNVVVAYLFLFAFSLFERDKGFLAVLLIMISGFTKVFGIFQLALLLCYPRFGRNMVYVAICSVGLSLLPLLKLPISGLLPYYGEWLECLGSHQSRTIFDSLFHINILREWALPNFRLIQIGSLLMLAGMFILNYKKYTSSTFRAQALGILMGWVILFSDSAEKHTYIIALAGYMLWYMSRTPQRVDRILLWANFVLLCIVPIDILCPVPIMNFICGILWLHIWIFLATWLRMCYITFIRPLDPANEEQEIVNKE